MQNGTKLAQICFVLVAINISVQSLDVNAQGGDGSSALMVACIKGHFRLVQLLLRAPGIVMNPPVGVSRC